MKDERDYENIPESDIVVNYISQRYSQGLYTLTLVIGNPGKGKSSSCLRLSELTSEKIGKPLGDKIIIGSLFELIDFVKDSEPGDIGIIEEMSVLFPSRRAMAAENVDIARVLDTCRSKRVILFANAPIWGSIDSHIRSLANISIEAINVIKSKEVVLHKPIRLQTHARTGKTYYHKFKRNGFDVDFSYTRKPSKELWDFYEAKKKHAQDELYDKLKNKHLAKELKEKKDRIKMGELVTPQPIDPEKIMAYRLNKIQGMGLRDMAKTMNRSKNTLGRWVKEVELQMQNPSS